MAEAAHNLGHEYWRPPRDLPPMAQHAAQHRQEACPQCHTEYAPGSRFCHGCGTGRDRAPAGLALTASNVFPQLRRALGLGTASLVAFLFGAFCFVCALGTGLVYSTDTLTDWQAVQFWRIEWLLAAVVALLAGILLRDARST